MADDHIRYDLLIQDALRSVLRKVLTDAQRDGRLPGEHHFFITFRTDGAGVRLSTRMREKYPEEMTIVIQHQYRDLEVTDHAFEVGLTFGGIPERLLIPFSAIVGFSDPSVQFAIKFEATQLVSDAAPVEEPPKKTTSAEVMQLRPLKAKAKPAVEEADIEAEPPVAEEIASKIASAGKEAASKAEALEAGETPELVIPGKGTRAEKSEDKADKEPPSTGGAQVLSIDAFRKKK